MNKKSLVTLIIAQILLIGTLIVIASENSDEVLYQSNDKDLIFSECENCDKAERCNSQSESECNSITLCDNNKSRQCENDCTEKTTCQQIEKQHYRHLYTW